MNGDGLNIRSFEANDQKDVHRLILHGLGEHFSILDPTLNPDLDDIAVNYLDKGDLFVVAEINKQIIAAGALVRESLGTGRIVRVSVSNDYRRKRIGQEIVNHLLASARDLHLNRILVETNLDWYPAIHFYQKLGFREEARDSESIHFSLMI